MLVLCPYRIPIKPTKKRVNAELSQHGLLLQSERREQEEGRPFVLKTWAEESPEFEAIPGEGEIAVIRVFIHYIEHDPEADFNEKTGETRIRWEPHRLSRVTTVWIPLSPNSPYDFLLSAGHIGEENVKSLLMRLLPAAEPQSIGGYEYDFPRVRANNPHGWMHGCENRPKTIQRGVLYGDFDFSTPSEVDDFVDQRDGTRSNQEGVVLASDLKKMRKVRVLRHGKFQLMGVPKDDFYGPPNRRAIMAECFHTAQVLLKDAV
jgi:hypothetical protein